MIALVGIVLSSSPWVTPQSTMPYGTGPMHLFKRKRFEALGEARHQTNGSEPVLVMHRKCPFAQRAWFGFEESGLEYTLRECELYPKAHWLTT